jgi:uncharacterized protein (DUF486 family)
MERWFIPIRLSIYLNVANNHVVMRVAWYMHMEPIARDNFIIVIYSAATVVTSFILPF